MSSSLPVINEARVSFIKPIVLPDLLTGLTELKPEFSFLASAADYAQYYKDLEWNKNKPEMHNQPVEVPGLGSLRPLRRKYTMHSYWKSFRRTVEMARFDDRILNELFLLLPLIIKIPIRPIKVNRKPFLASAYAYLFPFGCCSVNIDIKISEMPFDEFINLIPNLKRSSIVLEMSQGAKQDMKAFNQFSHKVSSIIYDALLGVEKDLEGFSAHTFVFVKKTSMNLSDSASSHKSAIAAVMNNLTFQDVSGKSNETVERYLCRKLKTTRLQEILFFKPSGSFYYVDPDWDVHVPKDLGDIEELFFKRKKLRSKMECMRNNYQSCLNVLFAVNRVLKYSASNKEKIPSSKLEELKRCFGVAFPEDTSSIYFKHVFEQVAPTIGLDNHLKGLRLNDN